jgi:hypothetical protein
MIFLSIFQSSFLSISGVMTIESPSIPSKGFHSLIRVIEIRMLQYQNISFPNGAFWIRSMPFSASVGTLPIYSSKVATSPGGLPEFKSIWRS